LLLPCARILSRGKSLLGGRAEPVGNRLSCAETGVCSSRCSHKEGYQIILLKFISLSCGLPSAVHIRLFVPHSLTVWFSREKNTQRRASMPVFG
jgi:hypothetical protein